MKFKLIRIKLLFRIFSFFLFFTIIALILEYNNGHGLKQIKELAYNCLQQSVTDYTFRMTNNHGGAYVQNKRSKREKYKERIENFKDMNYVFDQYEDSILFFSVNDEWEYRTIIACDSIFNKKVPKRPGALMEELYQQTFMMIIGTLNVDSILNIYKEKLSESKIYVNDKIYLSVKTSLCDSLEYTTYTGDKPTYNYATPCYHTGYLDEVEYQAYMNISIRTVYTSIHKPYLNFLYGILITLFLIITTLCLSDYRKRTRTEIKKISEKRYLIGHLLFDHETRELSYFYQKNYSMPPQTADLLLLFLQGENYSVNKAMLRDMFVNVDNMTSAVGRLKKTLAESGAKYEVINVKEENCYRLALLKKKREAKTSPIEK